jgi:predicted porin
MKKFSQLGIFTLTMALTILFILPAAQAVDFKISGHINRAILGADNGNDNDVFFVDNEISNSRFRFTGANDFNEVWKVGIVWEVEMESNTSDAFDIGENDDLGGDFGERKLEFYVEHKSLGKVWLGQGDTASNGTSEVDLSGTDLAAYSGFQDVTGGINFRQSDDTPIATVGDSYSQLDGLSRRDRIRYDTPRFGPVYFSGSYLNGQSWDLAGRFAYEWEGIGKLAAAAGYTGAENQRFPFSQYNGSISFLHSSGFNVTGAAGLKDWDDPDQPDKDDSIFYYFKLGYKTGIHAVSVDYGRGEDITTDGDTFDSVGVAYVVRPWESVEFYGTYRWHTLDRDGVNDIEDINAAMIGGRVKF